MVDVRERSNIVTVGKVWLMREKEVIMLPLRQGMVDARERSNIVTVSKAWLMWEKEVILLP